MKRLLSSLLAFSTAAVFLVACGNSNTASSSVTENNSVTNNVIPPNQLLLSNMLTVVQNATGIGSSLVLTEADVVSTGDISLDDIIAFAGLQSMNYSQDAGSIYIVKTSADNVETVLNGFTNMNSDILSSKENYQTDFPDAYAHLENAVIKSEGEYVIYAVSANGEYDALNAAVDAALQLPNAG